MRVVYLLRKTVPSDETLTLQAVTMATELARAGASVELVVPELRARGADDLCDRYGLERPSGFDVCELRSRWIPRFNRWRGRPFDRALRRLLRRESATVAYTRGERGLEVAASLARARPCPVVYECHKIFRRYHEDRGDPAEKVERAARVEASVYAGADGIVSISRTLAEAIREEHGRADGVLVAPNGTAPNPYAGTLERDEEIVYAGDLAGWKGVGVLVDAMERLPDRTLRIVGGYRRAPRSALIEDVRSRGLSSRVRIEGPRPAAEIKPLLARARVVAIPLPLGNAQAARFTSPLKLFEALEAGCAVVASDVPSIREVVENDRDALLVPPNDPDALATALGRVLRDDVLRSRLAAAGRETAREYHWSRRARTILGFLEGIARV